MFQACHFVFQWWYAQFYRDDVPTNCHTHHDHANCCNEDMFSLFFSILTVYDSFYRFTKVLDSFSVIVPTSLPTWDYTQFSPSVPCVISDADCRPLQESWSVTASSSRCFPARWLYLEWPRFKTWRKWPMTGLLCFFPEWKPSCIFGWLCPTISKPEQTCCFQSERHVFQSSWQEPIKVYHALMPWTLEGMPSKHHLFVGLFRNLQKLHWTSTQLKNLSDAGPWGNCGSIRSRRRGWGLTETERTSSTVEDWRKQRKQSPQWKWQ